MAALQKHSETLGLTSAQPVKVTAWCLCDLGLTLSVFTVDLDLKSVN